MKFETKFNKGDVVWVVERQISKYFVDCFVIGKILISFNEENEDDIRISYARTDSFNLYYENECFKTKEEAEEYYKKNK